MIHFHSWVFNAKEMKTLTQKCIYASRFMQQYKRPVMAMKAAQCLSVPLGPPHPQARGCFWAHLEVNLESEQGT